MRFFLLLVLMVTVMSCAPQENEKSSPAQEEGVLQSLVSAINSKDRLVAADVWTYVESLNTGKLSAGALTSSSVTFTWDAVSGVVEYLIVKWNFTDSAWELRGLSATGTYTDTNLAANTTHRYAVLPLKREILQYGFSAGTIDLKTNAAALPTTTTTLLSQGNATNGATLYRSMCVSCHGANGQGGLGSSLRGCSSCRSFSTLRDVIKATMPQGSVGSCTGTCADDVAAYILKNFQ